jgi:hypothetical protein
MLQGLTVPAHWPTVEAVLIVLCDLAGVDPDATYSTGDYLHTSRRLDLERAWHRALDHPDERHEPISARTSGAADDPWATAGSDGDSFSDEPPF